ncbi:MAG: polymorphic toxin type 50 domain-containing protein [Defluviitaleaceae bacterium]|nr:polymorphic toxin type 50 domain-containing protein [Defluviitaleaceae bacterium]
MNMEILKHIKSPAVDKIINPEKQGRHILGHRLYIDGRSYLLDGVDPQELVDKYHGTGDIKVDRNGNWDSKEYVTALIDIGVDIDPKTGQQTITNRFTIHYSKTGTHIVPTERRDYPQ